jgi:FkbH-like protein
MYLYEAGIRPNILFGGYDTFRQDLLDDSSGLCHQKPEVMVLSLILEQFDPQVALLSWDADGAIKEMESLYSLAASKGSALIVVNTFIPPFTSELGIAHSVNISDKQYEVGRLNQFIRNYVRNHAEQFFLADWDRYVRILGEKESIDYRFWYMYKSPFKKAFLELYASDLTRVAAALKGKAKKCLILDCDNTLWGGVVGEDGMSGIHLDRDVYPGKAFYDFQRTVLHLYERGVLIALCSKNNEDDVWEVFDKHPYSLLKREHISAWCINWGNKADGIRSIAHELNLGMDSLVVVDDSPAEREMIRTMAPDVMVINVPMKLYEYPQILIRSGLFDTLYISGEDKKRTQLYRNEKRRKNELHNFNDIDAYLESLDMVACVKELVPENIGRIAQLTQKTNQFNLTTKRYSELQIKSMLEQPSVSVYALSVRDKYGDLGLTGVCIVNYADGQAVVDTFLMSCRILGRKLEYVFVDRCMQLSEQKWHIRRWIASYIPSRKNQQTADFWKSIGFEEIASSSGAKQYVMDARLRKKSEIQFIKMGV